MTGPSIWGVHDYVASYTMATVDSRLGDIIPALAGPSGYGGPTGCGFYRIILPLSELAKHGWRTTWRAGVPPQAANDYRLIVAQRLDKQEALPIWRNLRLRHRLIYETDDDIFSVPEDRWKHATYPQHVMQSIVEHAAQIADVMTVSTEPLAEVYRDKGIPDVRVLPNCIPGGVLDIERLHHHRKLVVGYTAGGSHGPDLLMIAPVLRDFLDKRGKKAMLHLMGSNFTSEIGRRCRYSDWVQADLGLDYYRRFDFDIGLAPLRGTVFDQSKSAIKALEYMALGIPVLASDATPYRGIVQSGVNGYLCKDEADWTRRLEELANDPDARRELGERGREMARSHTIEANWQRWADTYRELL
jgi:glycosyltransferase involved in cell wall biosynthesis